MSSTKSILLGLLCIILPSPNAMRYIQFLIYGGSLYKTSGSQSLSASSRTSKPQGITPHHYQGWKIPKLVWWARFVQHRKKHRVIQSTTGSQLSNYLVASCINSTPLAIQDTSSVNKVPSTAPQETTPSRTPTHRLGKLGVKASTVADYPSAD